MRSIVTLGLVLALTPVLGDPALAGCSGPQRYGTSVDFRKDGPELAKLAQEQKRPRFVLHISGEFENAGYT